MAKLLQSSSIDGLKKKDQTVREQVPTGGSLVARRLTNHTAWRYHYRHDGRARKYTFGSYDPRGNMKGDPDAGTYTLAGARKRAAQLSMLRDEVGDLVEHFAEVQAQAKRVRDEAQAERTRRKIQAMDYSLAKLCEAYWCHLAEQKRRSATDVKNALTKWVINKHPTIAAKTADSVTTDDVMVILRAIFNAGHTTMTNRVRSHLSAAYTLGADSSVNAIAANRASGFNLTINPVQPTKRLGEFERAGERVLSEAELQALLQYVVNDPRREAQAVLLSLRLGGQRLSQLLALKATDATDSSITLWDNKGKRLQPRRHELPLVGDTVKLVHQALENPHPQRSGLYSGISMHTVSKYVRTVSAELGDAFTWRDLRRTCETLMAGMGISKDTRAQLLSHGLGGVQDKHYDRYTYLPEKTNALTQWNDRLDALIDGRQQTNNVVSITR